ncbi:alpha/beta hydrolase [Pendulispora rubella]|uniref:Alpha/beta hydrolase n=1 Tax=Pendulispora rubella TaxID=2741070 RepID=A0ABZ2KVT4_9BACT
MTEIHHPWTAADQAAMAAFRAKLAAHPIALTRTSFDRIVEQSAPLVDGVDYSEARVGGIPGVWCTPASRQEGVAMLYLHGGGYFLGTARAFRGFVCRLAARSGVAAFIADYRLAPEHPFPAAYDDARAAHRDLSQQLGAERVAIVGDSAGGGLALSLLQEEPSAACGVLLAPWSDLALTGNSLDTKAADDPVLTRSVLEDGVRKYLGAQDPRDRRASPLYGRTRGTPPIQVHVGTAEILLDDALRLGSSEKTEVHVWEGMPHSFPRSVALFEAARAAQEIIAAFLRANLVPTTDVRSMPITEISS